MADVAVVGGSLAGLMAGLLLHRGGHHVRVYERAAAGLSSRGAGIVTHSPLFEALRRCGLTGTDGGVDPGWGVPCLGRVAYAADGTAADEVRFGQTLTSWDVVYRRLLGGLSPGVYRTGHAVVGFDTVADGVELELEGGVRAEAQWLIGADGIRSTVRGVVAPRTVPSYVGYVAWRGLVEERRLTAATRLAFESRMAFSLPEAEQMLGYFVAGADDSVRPGQRRFNWVWYRPAPAGAVFDALVTDADGRVHRDGLSPAHLRDDVVAAMRAAAGSVLSPQFAEVVAETEQPLIQPIFDLESARLRFGRVLLMGDAAFVARPHVGAGVTKAAEDAMALAEAFGSAPEVLDAALAGYERDRLAAGAAIVARARWLGAYLEGVPGAQARSVREVLCETAVPLA